MPTPSLPCSASTPPAVRGLSCPGQLLLPSRHAEDAVPPLSPLASPSQQCGQHLHYQRGAVQDPGAAEEGAAGGRGEEAEEPDPGAQQQHGVGGQPGDRWAARARCCKSSVQARCAGCCCDAWHPASASSLGAGRRAACALVAHLRWMVDGSDCAFDALGAVSSSSRLAPSQAMPLRSHPCLRPAVCRCLQAGLCFVWPAQRSIRRGQEGGEDAGRVPGRQAGLPRGQTGPSWACF